jgi:hypothetical protein
MQFLLIPMFACLRNSKQKASVEESFSSKSFAIFWMVHAATCSYFDQLQKDVGYAPLIETNHEDMVSSHPVKRFLKTFSLPLIFSFRKIHLATF